MDKSCRQCNSSFQVDSAEQLFLKKMCFIYGHIRIDLPEPVECPNCRLQIRAAHRNEQHMYSDISDLSGKKMISLYASDSDLKREFLVYSSDEWHSDSWEALSYGRSYDFSCPFFEQFRELQKSVPRLGLVALNNENCPYTTGTAYCRNCYLISCSEHSENCYYGKLLQSCRDCVDCSYAYNCELCYEGFSIYDCYACRYLSFSKNSSNCWFSENLTGCSNCLFCTNLHGKDYCIDNKAVSKEEFQNVIKALAGSSREFTIARERWQKIRQLRIHKYSNISNSENCSGDFISSSKNCRNCYDLNESEDCRWVCVGVNVKDMYDCSNVYLKQELSYQIMGAIGNYNCAFSSYVFHSQNILYSDHIFSSKNLFGCVGLKHKEFCIFNRQYSENEYNKLVPQIIASMRNLAEWGRFFPIEHSPFCYNESLAYDYFPLNQQQVIDKNCRWKKAPSPEHESRKYLKAPDHIDSTSEDICKTILQCEISGREFKIILQELSFYKTQKIPIPDRAPIQRHYDREALRNSRQIWQRFCEKCGLKIATSFNPAQPEVVYCEDCFLKTVY